MSTKRSNTELMKIQKRTLLADTILNGFLVKSADDDSYYALEKEEYALEYNVVNMLNEGDIRKLIEEMVTLQDQRKLRNNPSKNLLKMEKTLILNRNTLLEENSKVLTIPNGQKMLLNYYLAKRYVCRNRSN
ncbi:hypothetical protein [Butyrivibrio sp. AE3004]|uniref:hypothetical protein n=1 Tax=Butyrivibrio sp. AE3004 TaxID=1506994 RepID=UPI0018CC094E|nr:hypothetical protein [Butyrivibrio sp. AE3004]